jgi:hypothetical protein
MSGKNFDTVLPYSADFAGIVVGFLEFDLVLLEI